MMPLGLTTWFRRRMFALVAAASVASAAAPPVAYHLQKRNELVALARSDAERVGAVVASVAEQRPRLWAYDVTKISERLTAEGLSRLAAFTVRDGRGGAVMSEVRAEGGLLWGRREAWLGGKLVAVVWVGVETRAMWVGTLLITLGSTLVAALIGAVLYLLPVRAIARAERRVAGLMGQLALTLQEEERGRIARDLHDGAGQALTAARLHLLALRRAAPEHAERLGPIVVHLDEALDEVRRSTAVLMPPALVELGLRGALVRHCEAVAQATGLEVSFEAPDPMPAVAAHVETACYRVVQEALTNVARHAGAKRAWVSVSLDRLPPRDGLEGEPALRFEVRDDGRGLASGAPRGSGLESIAERARLLGGEASFADAGPGLRVRVTVPLTERSP